MPLCTRPPRPSLTAPWLGAIPPTDQTLLLTCGEISSAAVSRKESRMMSRFVWGYRAAHPPFCLMMESGIEYGATLA